MNIRPQDLPELRNDAVVAQDAGGYALRQWLWLAEQSGQPASDARNVWRREIERLASAPLFYVSPEMTELAAAAAQSLPSFVVNPEDLPTDSGLLVFGSPIGKGVYVQRHPGHSGEPLSTRALLWSREGGSYDGIWVTGYVDRDALLADALANGGPVAALRQEPWLSLVPDASFGLQFGEKGWHLANSTGLPQILGDLFPVLMSTWLLMKQPLARTAEVEVDRASRKRLRRAGQEPKPVRVIELRRPQRAGGEPGDGESNYQHQWIVRGHWRNHWHPKRQVHRPVWIAPHIKGPEGAPLIGGEKVYALKR
ncbi:hypothetical protein [Streptomyces sp. ECR3.8]|uniref:hypothetical protein n=1 Tax=Streptomyces sp. ECR3.8 TaxID=3461009 RepID=UPI004041ADFC